MELGASEKKEFQVLLSNRYPQPSQWDASVVGEFSEDKYAFMVTILGKLYDQYADWSTDLICVCFDYYLLHDKVGRWFSKNTNVQRKSYGYRNNPDCKW